MRKGVLRGAVVSLVLTGAAYAGAQCPTGDGAVVARYLLDESEGLVAHDDVGGYDGALVGGPAWHPDGGVLCGGGALALDGLDDHVDLPGGAWSEFGADESFSVSCCFAAAADPPTSQHIVGRYHPSNDGGMAILYGIQFEGGPSLPGHVAFSFRTDYGGAALYVVSTQPYQPGVWHSVCAIRDRAADELRLYVDGELAAPPIADTFPEDQGMTQNRFVIGRCGDSDQSYFAGLVDRVVIWRGFGPSPADCASWSSIKALYR